MEEKATSSSRKGAMPVHSEFRQPRISSSSAIGRSSCSRSFTRLLQLFFERIAVDPVVVPLQLVDELVDLVHGRARDDPERDRLASPAELLAGVPLPVLVVRRLDRARVREGLPLPLLPEDLVDHARALTGDASRPAEPGSGIASRRCTHGALRARAEALFPPAPHAQRR